MFLEQGLLCKGASSNAWKADTHFRDEEKILSTTSLNCFSSMDSSAGATPHEKADWEGGNLQHDSDIAAEQDQSANV